MQTYQELTGDDSLNVMRAFWAMRTHSALEWFRLHELGRKWRVLTDAAHGGS